MAKELTDKELYRNYLNGDKQAFEQLVLKYKNNIIYFISRYTKNTEIAEDISQDVFVYLLVNKEQYDFKYSFKTYLYMIAKCRAINYFRKEKKVVNMSEYEDLYIEDNDLEDEIYRKENSKILKYAMSKLKTDYQVVIYLTNFEDMKYKEVAKVMDKNVGQIKVLLNRAKHKLKEILEKEGFSYDG